jgi:hypothetical protein
VEFSPRQRRRCAQHGAIYIQLLSLLLDRYDDLATAVHAVFTQAAEGLENTGYPKLCPVGTVTGAIADTVSELRRVAAAVIAHRVDWGSR